MPGNHGVVGRIEHHLGILEQFQLLLTFLVNRFKILLMGRSDIRNHTDGGLYDVAKRLHLPLSADSCLKDAHLRLLVQQPYR